MRGKARLFTINSLGGSGYIIFLFKRGIMLFIMRAASQQPVCSELLILHNLLGKYDWHGSQFLAFSPLDLSA
jgi:hypothetical protein